MVADQRCYCAAQMAHSCRRECLESAVGIFDREVGRQLPVRSKESEERTQGREAARSVTVFLLRGHGGVIVQWDESAKETPHERGAVQVALQAELLVIYPPEKFR